MILGTAGYMSPEQAAGQPADRRADIWSFGVVLFEMLAGRRAFAGETVSDTLAECSSRASTGRRCPPTTPPAIRDAARALPRSKSPRQRLQAIGEARLVIEDCLADASAGLELQQLAAAGQSPRAVAGGAPLPWASRRGVAGCLGARRRRRARRRAPTPAEPASAGRDVQWRREPFYDGSAPPSSFARRQSDRLHRRPQEPSTSTAAGLDQLDSTILVAAGTDTHGVPIIRSSRPTAVGRLRHPSEMRKVPVTGGTPLTICKVNRSRGATWLPDDTIVFAPSPASGLSRVAGAGGEPPAAHRRSTRRRKSHHRWPQALPGGDSRALHRRTAVANDFDNADHRGA